MSNLVDSFCNKIYHGDATEILKNLPDNCIDCVVTSPPYWNLRDYEAEGQMGLEGTFVEYVHKMCNMFDEVMRVLKDTGTVWVNIGDTYYGSTKRKSDGTVNIDDNVDEDDDEQILDFATYHDTKNDKKFYNGNRIVLPKKSLCLVPYRFAIEMVNRGWILRNTIIWHKPSVMPRPVKDRFTIDFEDIFFFTKSEKYYFDMQYEKMVSKVNVNASTQNSKYNKENIQVSGKSMSKYAEKVEQGLVQGRIKRTVWSVNTSTNRSFHVAPYPEDLITPMIKAGCPENGIVLDMFMGSGTTAMVALKQGKRFIGIDIDERAVSYARNCVENYMNQITIFDII